MDNKIKNYLGIAIVVAIFVFAAGYLSYVGTYSKSIQPSSYRSFSVSGEGKITVIPDIAQFTFSIITEGGKDIVSLQKDNTDKTNKAIDFLKAQGIEAKDIKTTNYNLEPRYKTYDCRYYSPLSSVNPSPCPPAEIVGYTITQTALVKIRDFVKIGDVLSGVVSNGANSVSSLTFTIDDPTAIENNARNEAISQARTKADQVAQAGGFTVGRLISIEEGYQPYYYGLGAESAKFDSAAPSAAPVIEPGSQEVTVNVTLRYEIQ
ncbi:MAG: SIMPL domain-containing protein [Candidatus Pacebacteria bacterium]|nr:SIMPL domain-containing protein [Candidatus Paceibacterota bacterium]